MGGRLSHRTNLNLLVAFRASAAVRKSASRKRINRSPPTWV